MSDSRLAPGCLLAITVWFCPVAQAQLSEGIEDRFPLPDTYLGLVFHPDRMMDRTGIDEAQQAEFLGFVRTGFGIDLSATREIHLRFGSDPELEGSPGNRLLISLESPSGVDLDSVRDHMFSRMDFTEQTQGEYTLVFFRDFEGRPGPCLCAPDSETLLLGVMPRVVAALGDDPDSTDERRTALTDLQAECDLCGYFDFARNPEQTREMLEFFFAEAPFARGDIIDDLLKIETGYFNVTLSEDTSCEGVFVTGSSEDARDVATACQELLKNFGEVVENSLDQPDALPDETQVTEDAISAGVLEILKHAHVSTDDKRVVVTVSRPGGIVSAWDRILRGMLGLIRQSSPGR